MRNLASVLRLNFSTNNAACSPYASRYQSVFLLKNTGKGYGKYTFNFIVKRAKDMKVMHIGICAKPNAEGFYTKMGGKFGRQIESKINGRFLRVFQFEI